MARTLTSKFNSLIKELKQDIDFSNTDYDDMESISILEPTCDMDFCNYLIKITKEGRIITQQFENDLDSLMENKFSDIMFGYDKQKIIEILEKFVTK